MSTLPSVELGVLGPLQVRKGNAPVVIPGAKPRAILTMLGLHYGSVVPADALIGLLWGDDPPRTAAKALQTHVSSLRRTLGDGVVVTEGAGYSLQGPEVDASRYRLAAKKARDAAAAGDTSQALALFDTALLLWRGIPELPDGRRGWSETTRWVEGHAALVEDRADALLASGRAAEVIGDLEAAVGEAPLRERRWGQLMLALYRAGRQGEALGAYRRARALLSDELGVDPGPELRRLEAAIVAQDSALDTPVAQQLPTVMRAVTFLLTDIEGSTAAWEADAKAMAVALARHDELVEQVVTSQGGRLIKTRGEGDATFSVFERPSTAAAAAIELQDAIGHEPWELREPMRIRVALHTGEVELRDGDYFGRAVNRAARLRSLAAGGQILCSGATAELVIDSLSDDVVLTDLGMRQLKNLARPEHVFELRLQITEDSPQHPSDDAPIKRPSLPAILTGPGPFVGRGNELERLLSAWQTALDGGMRAALIAGEPGVGKTRLAGEWSRQAYEQDAVVLYGRCDEDLGAPYQPFAEALRALVPCLDPARLRGLRGVEALLALVPGLADVLPDLAAPTRADPDTERYALFDSAVALLEFASASTPIVLVLDDLHWAAKPTLLLLRHLLRFGEHARVQIVGTYRSTDLDRSHPLAAMLADLHRDNTASRISLSGLDQDDVTSYVAEAGYDDEDLAHALATVTGGNPFFLIEALRHVDESGGVWDQNTLPQGVREAVSRRLSRLPIETNKALAAAAVVGSRFPVDLVEKVVEQDLVDAFDEACKAGIVVEEPGGYYRFNHAIVRQALLAELASVRRLRLHQRIATTLETQPGAEDELLAELAHHYFECAWAGNASKAVFYCRRAADQAMARLAYEGAADLYDHALHALEELDEELADRDDQAAELLIARCEALLAAGDVASAARAVSQLQQATVDSARLAAWATCFDGQLSMLIHPERLDDVEAALAGAAAKLASLDDAAGEAKAHTVRAGCLARLGRIGDCEVALDDALTSARRARDHRRVNAVLAGAPLAALWGPNPVPRAGGRCLDVVRLLRITTDSPAVEATSTRCQAVLEAFRGRAAAARRMIDSARRTVTELGLRHALAEVEQYAGIVELVVDDAAAAELCLRKAYNGFRRMGLDADTAETAALLGRALLALDRDSEADELCTESERLAGHALKASIAWRTLRAQLLSRAAEHDQARLSAEAAVSLAERTDLLADHGDACLGLAAILGVAGDAAGARAAAERAVNLYEVKGAAALAEKAKFLLGNQATTVSPRAPEPQRTEWDNACVRAVARLDEAMEREAWDEYEDRFAAQITAEDRRKVVGFARAVLSTRDWVSAVRRIRETGVVRNTRTVLEVRGERLALSRLVIGTADASTGAPQDEMLHLFGIDTQGKVTLLLAFDVDDIDTALAELDAMQARFADKSSPARRLENAASQAEERFLEHFAARDWDATGQTLADSYYTDDRRRVVGAGVRHGRDAEILDMRAIAGLGVGNATATAIATRGDSHALIRTLFSVDAGPNDFATEILGITECDAQNRITARVVFDPDDFDAAIAELDARYLAGEAAAFARTWSVITGGYAVLNRHELPPTTPDCVSIDHRRTVAFAPGEAIDYIRTRWDVDQPLAMYIEQVHRLGDVGAVVTRIAHGSQEGFDAEWRGVDLLVLDGEMVSRSELFDETDLDAALALFDQLHSSTRRLENAASRVERHFQACLKARDSAALAATLTPESTYDDRRRVVNAGLRRGRNELTAGILSAADFLALEAWNVIAMRGERLVLSHYRYTMRDDQRPESFEAEGLGIVEIDADERIVTRIAFDPNDFDAAFAELEARYLAGEAAVHAHVWSVLVDSCDRLNRRELPLMTADMVSIDHRGLAAFPPGVDFANVRIIWEQVPDICFHVETVHRLSAIGTALTVVASGTSQEGLAAEWRMVQVSTIHGDRIDRCELFGQAELEAALTCFEELCSPAMRLENAATRVYQRVKACFAARDWPAIAEMLAENVATEDRRRVVNAGGQQGRDAVIKEFPALAEVANELAIGTIATRGARLALSRVRAWGHDEEPDGFSAVVLDVVELDADERLVGRVVFDIDDLDAAVAELDARYLAGEAAGHARTWSVITRAYAALNRREIPPTTPDWVNVDHRRGGASFTAGELPAYARAAWDLGQDVGIYIEAVHRLRGAGAVLTSVSHGTFKDGFDAEWRSVDIFAVEGEMASRYELFDEADLEAAVARFDQLDRPAPHLSNAASQVTERFLAHFAAGDWDAMGEKLADSFVSHGRRRLVSAETLRGREAQIAHMRVIADLWSTQVTQTDLAVRGERLVLSRLRFSGRDQGPDAFFAEILALNEIDADERIAAHLSFDPDDLEGAFEELDARYLAGEGATHSGTWSVIARAYAALNRREIPTISPDFVDVDHRQGAAVGPGDLMAYLRVALDDVEDNCLRVEAVHRLNAEGAVVTHRATGTSREGLDVEWRITSVFSVVGELINRCEMFDECDIAAALARFDELHPPLPRLDNAASQQIERFRAAFAARDWSAMAEVLAFDVSTDDRRRVVNAGNQRGRDIDIANMRALAEIGVVDVASTIIATRGQRLALSRGRMMGRDRRPDAFHSEALGIIEIDTDDRISTRVVFDPDDLNAAVEELDARFLAGDAAPCAQTWSVIAAAIASVNRQEFPPTTPDWVSVDHRRGAAFAPGGFFEFVRAAWEVVPDMRRSVEAVHRLSSLGAVIAHAARGTSREGFDAEWRNLVLVTVEGELISRFELFDQADLDAALARFDQLTGASRVGGMEEFS